MVGNDNDGVDLPLNWAEMGAPPAAVKLRLVEPIIVYALELEAFVLMRKYSVPQTLSG